jgi:hypothetical protein
VCFEAAGFRVLQDQIDLLLREGDDVRTRLAAIWAELLATPRIGARSDFFALGGHSLLATRAVARIREEFGVELPLRACFEHPELAVLAAEIDRAGPAQTSEDLIPRRQPGRALHLNPAQRPVWTWERRFPGTAAMHITLAWRYKGPLDADVLGRALDAVATRHEILRTTFVADGEDAVQVIHPAGSVPLRVHDLTGDAAEATLRDDARRLFDLAAEPPIRTSLVRSGAESGVLLVVAHHIAFDGWSVGVFLRELAAYHDALLVGRAPELPLLPLQYADVAVSQRRETPAERRADASSPLESSSRPCGPAWPLDRPRPAARRFGGGDKTAILPSPLVEALQALGHARGATLFMVALAAFLALLHRRSGHSVVGVSTKLAGRERSELAGLIGMFVRSMEVRVDLADDPPFSVLLARVRDAALAGYAEPDVPPTTDPRVMFVLQNAPREPLQLAGVRLSPLRVRTGTVKCDLSINLTAIAEGLHALATYDADLFDGDTIARMLADYHALLDRVVTAPDAPVSHLLHSRA